jgi:hypothetical protein
MKRNTKVCHFWECLKELDVATGNVYEVGGKRFCSRECWERYVAYLKGIRDKK